MEVRAAGETSKTSAVEGGEELILLRFRWIASRWIVSKVDVRSDEPVRRACGRRARARPVGAA